MANNTTITEQLTIMGVVLPAWPEEPEETSETSDWIQRGQIYAESLRLWQAQLLNAPPLDGAGGVLLTAAVQKLAGKSEWDQEVARYLVAGLKDGPTSELTLAAAKLVSANLGTKVQLLGCALELARAGLLVCAVEAVKQLLTVHRVTTDECLTISALLVVNLKQEARHTEQEPHAAGDRWLNRVALYHQASIVLASAACKCSSKQDRDELQDQLEALASLANDNGQAPTIDEYTAIAQTKSHERACARIQTLLKGNDWLQAVSELELLPKASSAHDSLREQIRAAVLTAFAGDGTEQTPADYAAVNQLREEKGATLIEQWHSGMDATASIERATPLVLIENFSAARRELNRRPFWIAYGNIRTGSTMVFNLMRIIANSLCSSTINAWEGDLTSPEKFFQLVSESTGVGIGVLKIHCPNDAVNAMLASDRAIAILSCRDMKGACFSYWRMLRNTESPFYDSAAKLTQLDKFIEDEIESFRAKSVQPNTLVVREANLRSDTLKSIRRMAGFMGVLMADESLEYLSNFLSPKGLGLLAERNQEDINSTGHESVTYLHPGHIAESSSEQQCTSHEREYIEALIHKYQPALDQDGYCKMVDTAKESLGNGG